MKAIINSDKLVLQQILTTIDTVMSKFYNNGTSTYSYIIKHPSQALYALIINESDIQNMIKNYPNELTTIGSQLLNSIVDINRGEWIINSMI